MRAEIVPFNAEHLDAAAELLAARVKRDCVCVPGLNARFSDSTEARAYLQTRWNDVRATGVVAIINGRLAGYLLASTRTSMDLSLPHRRAITRYLDYAARVENQPELYRAMYAALSPAWLAAGYFCHAVVTLASDVIARDAWVSLGFGEDLLFARRGLTPVPETVLNRDVEIRRGGVEDLEEVTRLIEDLWRYHSRSAAYVPYLPDDAGTRKRENEAGLADPTMAYWVACQDQRVLSVQVQGTVGANANLAGVMPDGDVYLVFAHTEPHARGCGIGTALLARGLAWAAADRHTGCAVGWMTGNLVADAFWRRHGFQPYLSRLARLVDPRIAWARG
jgi:GNAT superfamily N-acetyltransferase